MIELTDSAALLASVEMASGAATDSISKADVIAWFITFVFMILRSPIKSIE
ncbi:MAG: hypothetical protein NTAFB09_07220 [Nitrosospira sp.]